MSEAAIVSPAISRWRYREIVVILATLSAFGSVSIDMYLPAMPTIAREFHVPPHAVANTLATFFLGFAVGQAAFGPIADRFGRKPPLYAGIFAYILACSACALSHSVAALALARLLQALAACAGGVVARASVRDLFSPEELPRVFAAIMLVFGVSPLAAPFIGGYVLLWFGWRAIFWAQAAFGVIAFAAAFFRLEESHGGAHRPLHPLIILRDYAALIRDRRFIGFVLAGSLSNAGLFAYITGSPRVLIDLFHVPPEHFGWFFGINSLGFMVAAQLPARLIGRFDGARLLFVVQCAQALAGCLFLVDALVGGHLWSIASMLFIFVALTGAIMPTTTALAMRHFAANAGMASAMIGTLQFGTGMLVAGILGELPARNAVPMASVIAGCGVAAVLTRVLLAPPKMAGGT